MSTIIEGIQAVKIYNSRGEETLEIEVFTETGYGRASAPAGASTGKAEVVSYPEGGVDQAISKINEVITPELIDMNAEEQETIDTLLHEIDGTEDFRILGGNTVCSISLAIAEAASNSYGISLYQYLGGFLTTELPYPLGNVLGGGKHTSGKTLDFQEILVLPLKSKTFAEAAKANIKVHQKVGSFLKKKNVSFTGGKGDEGGWAPNIDNEDALEIVSRAAEEVSEEMDIKCKIGLDIAASALWNPEKEHYIYSGDEKLNSGEQVDFIIDIAEKYNLAYIEDPLHEDDFEGFAELTEKVKGCLICGDDLFVTNQGRLADGIRIGAGNSIIIKINQVGTLTDVQNTVRLAEKNQYLPVMSHRSGETTDPYLAHLAVAFRCPIIKTGILGGERISKINEIIRIEEMMGDMAKMSVLSL